MQLRGWIFLLFIVATGFAQQPAREGTASVSGRVTIGGRPARGVQVALQRPQGGGPFDLKGTKRATTDEEGQFRIERLAAGRYVLGAIAPGFVIPRDSTYGPQGKALSLADGENVENIEIALRPGGVITGRVTDAQGAPVVGESVNLSRLDDFGKPQNYYSGPMQNGSDDRGVYRLFGLPAGRYLVHVGFAHRPNSIMMTSQRVYLPRAFHPAATDGAEAKIVEVAEGAEVTGIDITVVGFKRNYDITGRVVYADSGRPAAGIEVHYGAMNEGETRIGAWGSFDVRTDEQGEFRFPSVLPGRYAAFVSTHKTAGYYCVPTPFDLRDGDVSGLEIRLLPGAVVSGVAVLEGVADPALAARLGQLRLAAQNRSPGLSSPAEGGEGKVAPDGTFRFVGLRPGRVFIQPMYDSNDRLFTLLRIERDGVPQPDGVEVAAGEKIAGIRLILGSGTGMVLGELKLVGGELPREMQLGVLARRVDGGLGAGLGGEIDLRGAFRIDRLPPGEYELRIAVYYPGSAALPPEYFEIRSKLDALKQRVTVSNGQAERVVLTVDLQRKEGRQ
ncbi:MAG: carboxypeptidase-like regulatory domain-containing protein [Blastocatellia bacterium]|nr:carboxypeptidase-like regulatory domain-containing protein [Blastocatellia bacterium]